MFTIHKPSQKSWGGGGKVLLLKRFRSWHRRFSDPINISINSSGKLINLEVQPTDSVKTIKHIIQMKENVPVDKQVTGSFNTVQCFCCV